jgi:hypothetical protein
MPKAIGCVDARWIWGEVINFSNGIGREGGQPKRP